jgi:hypothetical protein
MSAGVRLGWTVTPAGVAGTGYLADKGTPNFTSYGERLAAVLATNPDIIVVSGGINDSAGYDHGLVAAEVAALYARLAAATPRAIVVTPFNSSQVLTGGPSRVAWLGAVVKAQAAIYGLQCVDVQSPGSWVWGDGTVVAPLGTGNSDVYVYDTHPTPAGHAYLGTRFAFAISPPATGLAGGF